MKNYAIVGFGCAGYHAARAIRRIDPHGRIVIFSDTSYPPFNPMLTTYYAANRLDLEGVFPFGTLEKAQKELGLELNTKTKVLQVEASKRNVLTEKGCEKFDAILIATGAHALVPESLCRSGGRFFLMRTLEDAQNLREYLENQSVKKAVVVGASMVGIKVAELMCRRAIKTTMIDSAEYLFPLAAYKSTAKMIQEQLEKQPLEMVFNAQVEAIQQNGVALSDGRFFEADIVCLCIGTRANIELIANTQVVERQKVQIGRGIIVNERMETNMPGIYAAGDCCEGINLQTGKTAIIGLWANAGAQGDCAGRNMAGTASQYYGNILHNITHFFDMDFIGLGDPTLPGEHHTFCGSSFTVETVLDGNDLRSVNIFGNYRISGILKNHLTKRLLGGGAQLTTAQQGMLIAEGMNKAFIELIGGGGNI